MAAELVRYNWQGEIADVEEFEVAQAILAGDIQQLSQEVQSKHLFELCIAFGHQSTALALLKHGVPGCSLESWHLGSFAENTRAVGVDCWCTSSCKTCDFCCWGSDIENGVWMKDWGAKLADAVAAAREAAGRPVARAVLAALRSGKDFSNLVVSEAAMARLLDLAILTGDAELAQQCAQRCTRRPLRRWCSEDFFEGRLPYRMLASAADVMAAAILSGAALQGLSFRPRFSQYSVPLRESIALCGDLQLWQRLSPLLPEGQGPWLPKIPCSGRLFVIDGKCGLCIDRLRTVSLANMALSEFTFVACPACRALIEMPSAPAHLLDMAVYWGQSACAELLASCTAASVTQWTRKACLSNKLCHHCGVFPVPVSTPESSLSERRAAAGAALRAAFACAQRLAAPMGLGIYQVLLSWGHGNEVPKAIVNMVLSFAAQRPEIACVLDGLEEELLQLALPKH